MHHKNLHSDRPSVKFHHFYQTRKVEAAKVKQTKKKLLTLEC